jgi:hypothetical protein
MLLCLPASEIFGIVSAMVAGRKRAGKIAIAHGRFALKGSSICVEDATRPKLPITYRNALP